MLINHLVQESRSRAFSHRQRVVLCGTNNQVTCSNNWNYGILMFFDNHTHNRLRQDSEEILSTHTLTLKYGQLNWQGAGGNNILFKPNSGMARGSNGTFYYCAYDNKNSHKLVLSYMGHTRIEKISNCE